ncbi:hypothetical protein D018_3525B, partial [Vibrio parahaemolyticus VP2007-007]
NTPVASADI